MSAYSIFSCAIYSACCFQKAAFAVAQVKLPDVHEAGVKAQRQHLGALRQKGLAPALQGFGIIPQRLGKIGLDQARRNAIHTDIEASVGFGFAIQRRAPFENESFVRPPCESWFRGGPDPSKQ